MAASRPARSAKRTPARRRRRGRPRYLPILLTVALVGVLVLVFLAVRWYLSPVAAPQAPAADQSEAALVVGALASLPPSELQAVGQGTASASLKRITASALTGAGGRPQVLYVGADYCPFCAAERWPVAIALSRFGKLSGVGLTRSSSADAFPDTPTLTFHGATYASEYLDFAAVETSDRQGKPLDQLSPAQQALIQQYGSSGSIPFLDLGNRFAVSGAAYSPGLLQGMTQQQVVASLRDPSSPQAKAVLGSANVLTAALCQLTQQRPADVCGAPAVQSIQASLGGTG